MTQSAPRTCDGVPIVVGMTVWTFERAYEVARRYGKAGYLILRVKDMPTATVDLPPWKSLYSTRLAALTARLAELEADAARVRGEIAGEVKS